MTDAQRILDIEKPEELFPGDLDEAKKVFLTLAKRWHPDNQDGDAGVMAVVNDLYDKAVTLIKDGRWAGKSSMTVVLESKRNVKFRYLTSRPFELGHTYIGDTHVSSILNSEFSEMVENAESLKFDYASERMEQEMKKYLPRDTQSYKLEDSRILFKGTKTPDLLCLRDVSNHYGGKLPPKHVAWIGSGLHNLACYLQWSRLVHSNISLDSVFIDPQMHHVALLDGWWYTTKSGSKITHLPERSVQFLPFHSKVWRVSDCLIDQELIRATIRELLGDIWGRKLKEPAPLVKWVKNPAEGDAVELYKQWHSVLEETFGKRRFVEMKLTSKDVYGKSNT